MNEISIESKGNQIANGKEVSSSDLLCPDCNEPLEFRDTYGNIDYCLDAIGHPRGEWDRPRHPVYAGDIYYCNKCECWWHTDDRGLSSGYPC